MAAAFDSSDEEERQAQHPSQPLKVDKLELPNHLFAGRGAVYISGLPGCWFRNTHQNMNLDMAQLVALGITDAVVLVTGGELRRYRAPTLLSAYQQHHIRPHHHPFQDGTAPTLDLTMSVLEKLVDLLQAGGSVLVHCMCGFGRAGVLAACLLQWLDDNLQPETSVVRVRDVRGARAVQTVAQYNFVMDFRSLLDTVRERSVSR